jgi:transposase
MASLQRHVVRGHTYWRIVESRRIDGRPRAVPILYLGSADALLARLLEAPAGRISLRSFQHGDVAALKAAADQLDVAAIIDRYVPKPRRGLSVGTTLLLAALNRAVLPRSKRGWASWAAGTSLGRLFPDVDLAGLTSQFFWDQMDCVSLDALRAIERDVTSAVVRHLGIKLDTLFYDTTNFFTYIASTNDKAALAQRGHSKQKRHDLRVFGLALLVSRHSQIPLFGEVYEGNTCDCTRFPRSLSRIQQRLAELAVDVKDVTIVYDAGNVSKANQALVDAQSFGYVAALAPRHHPDLMALPRTSYVALPPDSRLAGMPVVRLRRDVWGAERTVVLFVSERLRRGQIHGLEQHLRKRIAQLERWKSQLALPRSGPRSAAAAQRRIEALLKGQHVGQVLRVTYHHDRHGADRLHWWIDEDARAHLETEVFGKRLVMTNRDDWSTEDILLAYRGQSTVEAAFRQTKDDEHLAMRPQYHWTDHKIQVHAFICMLALLLSRVVEQRARALGHKRSLSALLESLGHVRLALVLHSSGSKGGRPRSNWQLEATDPATEALFRGLVPQTAPFVYTA